MYPPIASEKLKPFHLHYSTWFKKYPGTHEALDPESTKKMINHYQMFTSCRHCAVSHTYYLKLTELSAIISILQMRKLRLKVTLLASGRLQSSCSYLFYSIIPTKLICGWAKEDSMSPSNANCDECLIRHRNKVLEEKTEKTT